MKRFLPLVLVLGLGCSQSEPAAKNSATSACGDCCPCGQIDRRSLLTSVEDAPAKADNAWPMFGGTPARNMVSTQAKNLPVEWDIEEKKSLRWEAKVGSKMYGGPVISGGKVYVGTNNASPRDPAIKDRDKGVVMCFSEMSGKFLWQAVHDYPPDEIFDEVRGGNEGVCSTPVIDGQRLFYVTPGCEVICASTDDGKAVWRFDMLKELKVSPYKTATCSPVIVGDLLFVITGNGVNEEGEIPAPKAPSFVALHKSDGKLAWQNNSPGDKIIEGQWSNPAFAEVNGKGQIIFPGGDAWIYSFEPKTGDLIWKFNCHPGKPAEGERIRNYIVGTPVVHDNKLYVGLGLYPEHPLGTRNAYFFCIDITKKGDVSPADLTADNPANKQSGLVWAFGGPIEPRPKKGRPDYFGRTMSTAAVHNGLVYIAEEFGYLHCLDAQTGKRYWDHDFLAAIWGSPFVADGRLYIGTEDGDIVVFQTGKEKKLLAQNSMGDVVHSTPVAVGNVLYIATRSQLFALAKE